MNQSQKKIQVDKLTLLFSFGVLGVIFSLIMTIVTGYQEAQKRAAPPAITIPTPAIGS